MEVYSWLKRSLSRRQKSSLPTSTSTADNNKNSAQKTEERFYGITDQLIEFVKSFSIDTFKNFSLPDVEEGVIRAAADDGGSGNVRDDLSDWQERHAVLILSNVKELSQLRFRLCPGILKEQEFWRIYFKLVWSYVAEYELHAIRLAKLKQMRLENEAEVKFSSYEVEMSEAKPPLPLGSGASLKSDSYLKESSNSETDKVFNN
ncbi:uncharacterized protein LOC113779627 [Coffea eugenioides]|uniref:uncharacterized protein LOC113779627 n=1 Tax=Coffea eugenioides TaxID=49369 RepID=UPI000F60EB00|nr:uncharacterized protein LOC113779627 [Coffea eugenioides]